jgi:DNA repair protein RadC
MNYKKLSKEELIAIVEEQQMLLSDRVHIYGKDEAVETIRNLYNDYSIEKFGMLLLTSQNKVISAEILHIGTATACIVDVKNLVKKVVLTKRCTSVILFHNHPGGSLEFSSNDITMHNRIGTVLTCIGVEILDNFILTDFQYVSGKYSGVI